MDKRGLNYNNINEAFIFDEVLLMGIAYDEWFHHLSSHDRLPR